MSKIPREFERHLVRQALEHASAPSHFVSADEPGLRDRDWLEAPWNRARLLVRPEAPAAVLAIDELQKIPQWVAR